MRGGDSITGTKRSCSRMSQLFRGAAPAIDHIHHSKGPSSIINIDDLPDVVLVEILLRLPGYKLVFQCKCVSKRWCTLMSDPCFIGRFICLPSDHKQRSTLINSKGEELLTRMSLSSKPLTPLFKDIMSSHALEEEPLLVGAYNDLILCSSREYYQRDYYICNPHTKQWVVVPPPPPGGRYLVPIAEGFICDLPYHNYKKEDQKGYIIQVNSEYRCRVVRLILPRANQNDEYRSEIKVQIFSSETGEWRESIVSCPQGFRFSSSQCYANADNGRVYWMNCHNQIMFYLDPFLIKNDDSTTSLSRTGSSSYNGLIFELDDEPEMERGWYPILGCVGVYRGCLRMADFDLPSRVLFFWDFIDEEIRGGGRKLYLKQMRRYSFKREMIPREVDNVEILAFDPDYEDFVYISANKEVVMLHVPTGNWARTPGAGRRISSGSFFPVALPRWPTPVPKLPQHGQPSTCPV